MNHLNFFKPFESRAENHEDVLTRNFLILLKNIPLVQVGFFEMVRENVASKQIIIESSARGILKMSEIYTQVDSNDKLFKNMSDMNMLSIIISDDEFKTDHSVTESHRHARYDGVVICDPSWVFIIENKPSVHNIWKEQLNPNLSKTNDVNLISEPCTLSWRDIISLLNELLSGNLLVPFEHAVISEFLEYIDENYSWLNPYHKFELCKSNQYLLNRRCCAIMESYNESVQVQYHKGWKYFIDIDNEFIRKIALDSSVQDNNTWNINMWMYAGDVMRIAKRAYEKLDAERLFALSVDDPNFSLSANFHYSYRSSGLLWLDCPSDFEKYINYWKNHTDIRQIKRNDFETHFDLMVEHGIISNTEKSNFHDQILSKNYPNLNVCPGFLIKYTWDKNTAVSLDNKKEFEEDFRNKINAVISIFE